MAFVGEKIVTEEDKRYVAAIGFSYVTGKAMVNPRYWAIDREHEVVFVSCGGGGPELPEGYALYLDGEIILIEGCKKYSGSQYDNDLKILWRFEGIVVPKKWIENGGEMEKLKEIIREACIAYSQRGLKPSQVLEIIVEFKNEPIVG